MTSEPAQVARLHVATGDVDLANERFQRAFPAIRLAPAPDGRHFGFDFRRVGDGALAVDRMLLTGSAVGTGSIPDVVGIGRVREGRFGLEYGRTAIDTTGPYLRPTGRAQARMEDVTLELIELEPHRFADTARDLLRGSGRIAMLPSSDTAEPMSASLVPAWNRIADAVAGIAFDEAAFTSPLIRAGLLELVVSGLLATFPLLVEAGPAGGSGVGPATIRRAIAYIDAHLAEPIDTAMIAAAAAVPVRTLQAGFHQHVGVAPMEHVRVRRLAAVHQDLLDADPGGSGSVAEIARRWGFAHLARFAERYRLAYGEKPSETLRR
jgi:AraC-like DNA-binding protein